MSDQYTILPYFLVVRSSPDIVNVLPVLRQRVLLQLRDTLPGTSFAGQWGFFGGSVEDGELPRQAAARELLEELNIRPMSLHQLTSVIPSQHPAIHHVFCCGVLGQLWLREGADLAWVTLEDVKTAEIYSRRLRVTFPVIKGPYVEDMVGRALSWRERYDLVERGLVPDKFDAGSEGD